MDERENATAPETVRLRHPHTGDVQEVEATPECLTPLLIRGYVQATPVTFRDSDHPRFGVDLAPKRRIGCYYYISTGVKEALSCAF